MKQTYELIAPCHFGLEAVLKKEILDLGYEISQVEDGRVTFIGDDEAICRANVFLRTAERILLKAGSFRAETFEEPKLLPGKNLSRKMENSGLQRLLLLKASCSALPISSPL